MISSGSDEGEIIESSSEKATTTKPSFHDLSVDRPSRLRDSSSRSPASTGASHDKARTRDRSLSLDRPDKRRKRDTEDDRFESRKETRRFKVYYEDGDRERSRVSYADLDRTDRSTPRSSHGDYDSRRQYGSKRPRTRSRSPGTSRHGRYNSTNGNGGRGNIRDRESQKNQNHHGNRSYENRASDDYSVSSRTKVFVAGGPSKHMAEFKHEDATQDSHDDHKAQEINASIDEPDGQIEDTEASPEEPIDEAALIEQRRKRREAIAAKYRTQNTPLLVQALTLGNDSHEPSPAAKTGDSQSDQANSTPQTPDGRSREDSPSTFSIGKDEDLANHSVNGPSNNQQDEPSAADYDPTMDMREDKIRDDQKLHGEDMTSAAYDETQQTQQDVLLPTKGVETAEEKPRKGSDDFDMFAEDDDVDDMFAEQPPKANTHAHTLKAVPLPQGKALDMSMLDNWDDPEGYYKIILGELLDGRYLVQANLGKGMFSGVVRALDSKTKKLVAIKLIRNNDTMRKAGLKEIEILQLLGNADPDDKKHIIRLERHFEHKGHLCMVFENLSINLREVLKKFGRDVGINLRAVRAYAQQMFLGLSLLRKCNILHADLKPDNVLVNESRNVLKICDLGSASDASENEITSYLVSRFYRAPEIILGLPYDFAIDVWSIGCTLYELYTGKILFTGPTNNQMLRSIMECRGKFPHKLLRKGTLAHLHFDDMLTFHSIERDKLSGKETVRPLTIGNKPPRDLKTRLLATTSTTTTTTTTTTRGFDEADSNLKDLTLFVDFLDRCLALNPEKRCTPAEALRHPFLMRACV